MKIIMRFLCCTVLTLGLAGCGLKYMAHNDLIQRHRGENIEALIANWGAPQSTTPLPSGNSVYLFVSEEKEQEKTSVVRAETYGYNNDGKSLAVYQTVTKVCKTTVTADKTGQILNLSSQGDGCKGEWIKGN